MDQKQRRKTWNSKYEFAFNVLGYSVGLGNLWRFSYLCFKSGGGAFLIPYFLMATFVSLPLTFLEISVGQFTRHGCIAVWNMLPLMRGIGFASMMIFLYSNCFVLVAGWCYLYLFNSFSSTLPWASCGNEWNTLHCIPVNGEQYGNNTLNVSMSVNHGQNLSAIDKSTLSTAEFWNNYVLQRTGGIEDMGTFSNWKMVGCFALAWTIVYFCVAKGITTSGKVAYVTVSAPYLLMIALFFRGVTLDGAGTGILFYLKPNVTRLKDPVVWLDAGGQVLYSIGVTYGVLFALGSYNKRSFDCYKSVYFFVIANYASSIFFGFVVFAFIGHMAFQHNVEVEDVVEGGPGLVFQVLPGQISQLPLPQLWSVIFFVTLATLALDSTFGCVEGMLTALADYWPQKFDHSKGHFWRAVVCLVSMLLFLPQLFDGGIYIFELVNMYGGSGICLLWVAFFEAVAVSWIYGIDRLFDDVKSMIGYHPPMFIRYCLKYITPTLCLAIFIACCVRFTPLKMGDYVYPWWSNMIGWIISMSVVSCIPITAAVVLLKTPGSPKERLAHAILPTEHFDEAVDVKSAKERESSPML